MTDGFSEFEGDSQAVEADAQLKPPVPRKRAPKPVTRSRTSAPDETASTEFEPPTEPPMPLPVVPEEPELTTDEENEFVEAIHLGKKERDVMILGHVVTIRTLGIKSQLQIALITKQYEGTQGYLPAYRSAVAAAALVRLDHKPFYTPLTAEDTEQLILRKFEKLSENYYPVFSDQVFSEFSKLETEVAASLMKKLGLKKD